MSSNTKKLIILTAGLLLFSLLLGQIFGSSFPFGFWKNSTSFGGAKTFPVSGGFSKIDIESKTGDIRIYDSGNKAAKVVWTGSSGMKLSVGTKGDTLVVSEKYKVPWFLRFGIHTGKSEIAVYLPQQAYKELAVESDTGNIQIPARLKFSGAEIETDTGSIDFHADVSKDLKINTDTGRINCAGVKPENLEIVSDTGSINVSSVKASDDIELKSDTGRVTLNDVTAADKLEIKTDTGSVSLERCDAQDIEIKSDTGSINGTLLTGKDFSARSQTGKVSIPESSFGGSCKIQTDTGSITIRIEK